MRVPSANLSCIEVVGSDESTTRPDVGEGAEWKGVAATVGSGAAVMGVSLPNVLLTPWKADRHFGGSL